MFVQVGVSRIPRPLAVGLPDDAIFRFGNQGILCSDRKYVLPVKAFGTFGELHVQGVPGASQGRH